jgi:cob(I)alamin adenosyltransferase
MALPRAFIVPGASPGSGALDVARTMARAAERRVVELSEQGRLENPEVLVYLNRVSDLLFMLARFEDIDLPVELSTGDRGDGERTLRRGD